MALAPRSQQHLTYHEVFPGHGPSALSVNGGKLVPERLPMEINVGF